LELAARKGEKQCVTAMRYAGMVTCATSRPEAGGPRVEIWRTVGCTVLGLLIMRGVRALCAAQPSDKHRDMLRVVRGWFDVRA
jgi:hypothetical protein